MKNNFTGEALISLILLGMLTFFLNPLQLVMPHGIHAIMLPLLVIVFILFIGILWKEVPGDERQQLHKFIAARFVYFAGITTLLIGIIIESMQKNIDPWLIIAICMMLLAKIVGLIYGYLKH